MPSDRCSDGLSHSWIGDRTIYCEKCHEIRSRATGQRLDRPIAAGAAAPRQHKRKPKPPQESVDTLVQRIERETGSPPTMWRETRDWVVEVLAPTGEFVRFEHRALSEALKRASWAKWESRV